MMVICLPVRSNRPAKGQIRRFEMGKGGRKRRARRKGAANHGKRPNT